VAPDGFESEDWLGFEDGEELDAPDWPDELDELDELEELLDWLPLLFLNFGGLAALGISRSPPYTVCFWFSSLPQTLTTSGRTERPLILRDVFGTGCGAHFLLWRMPG